MPPDARDHRKVVAEPALTATTDQARYAPSTSDDAPDASIVATNSPSGGESPNDPLTELIVPELVGDESIAAFKDTAPAEILPAAAALEAPEDAAPK